MPGLVVLICLHFVRNHQLHIITWQRKTWPLNHTWRLQFFYHLAHGLYRWFFIFPYIGNSNPNWLSYFFRGVGLNHQLDRNHRSERWFTVIIQGIHPLIMKKHGLHLEKSGFDSQTRRSPSFKQALPWLFEFINMLLFPWFSIFHPINKLESMFYIIWLVVSNIFYFSYYTG